MRKTHAKEIISWLSALQHGAQYGQLECPLFLKPYHLVTLALMLKQNQAQWLELSEEIETYALRMGLWKAANIIPPYEMMEHPTQNKFLPVAALENPNDVFSTAKNLTALIYPNANKTCSDSMEIMLMELIENTYKHARVQQQLHGLVCAQSWPKGNLAQIVFADCGIGIRASLSENAILKTQLATTNACELACQLGITSKPNGHTGYGLALSRALMKQAQGTMLALSHQEGLYSHQTDLSFEIPAWEGCVIILEWPLNHTLDVNAVYDSWPKVASYEEI